MWFLNGTQALISTFKSGADAESGTASELAFSFFWGMFLAKRVK